MTLNSVPFEQFFQNIDAQLQSDTAPDVFRVDYDNLGTYAGRKQLLDLSSLLDPAVGPSFTEPMWQSVQFEGRPHGVLSDQLERAFTGGQSTQDTLAGITAGIDRALQQPRRRSPTGPGSGPSPAPRTSRARPGDAASGRPCPATRSSPPPWCCSGCSCSCRSGGRSR